MKPVGSPNKKATVKVVNESPRGLLGHRIASAMTSALRARRAIRWHGVPPDVHRTSGGRTEGFE